MAYLHSKGIIHHDLKPCNIFIDKNLNPKISDFGYFTKIQILKSLSRQSNSKMQNDPNYSAPEILNSEQPTKANDVYSFALIVFEILTKEKPFNHLKSTNQIFIEVVTKSERPKFPSNDDDKIPDCYKELIEACWAQNPNERPSFDQIVQILKNDSRFVSEKVDKKIFLDFVESIERPENVGSDSVKICEVETEKDDSQNHQKIVEENEPEINNELKNQENEILNQSQVPESCFNDLFDGLDDISSSNQQNQQTVTQFDQNLSSNQIPESCFNDLFGNVDENSEQENSSDQKQQQQQQAKTHSKQNPSSNQIPESCFNDLFGDLDENSEQENSSDQKQQQQQQAITHSIQNPSSNQIHSNLVSDSKDEFQNNKKIVEEVKTEKENQNLSSNQVENCSVFDAFGIDENEEFQFVEEKIQVPQKTKDYSLFELFDENDDDD